MNLKIINDNEKEKAILIKNMDTDDQYILEYTIYQCMACGGDYHAFYKLLSSNNIDHWSKLADINIEDFCYHKDHDMDIIKNYIEGKLNA